MPVTIPDEVLAAAHLSEVELRRELAVALFREERLTLAQASRLAEMNQFAFQSILADHQIPVQHGIEEFREDLRTIDALERRRSLSRTHLLFSILRGSVGSTSSPRFINKS